MADLIEQFFQRDLSEAEHEALSNLLNASNDGALKYERLLEQNYLATGLPQPTLPKGLASLPKAGGSLLGKSAIFKVLLAGTAATGLVFWKFWPKFTAETSTAVQQVSQKPVQHAISHKMRHVVPVKPLAVSPAQEGQELSVVVNTLQKSLVTVRILDSQGREVRALYTGFVDAGQWSFQWDGLLENGQPASAGDYRIDVQSGTAHLSKDIQIKLQPNP